MAQDTRPPSPPAVADAARGPRGLGTRVFLAILAAVLFAGFCSLGTWQVQRRAWKLDLIERVEQRVHAPAAPAPGPAAWPFVNARSDEYRHVRVRGHYLYDAQTLVQASTELGSGYWVMTPLRREDGTIVMINRGFVPSKARSAVAPAPATADGINEVSGLLRLSEPKGGFLRDNDPAAHRWYSRDVQALARAHSLARVAPYFIDAAAVPGAGAGVTAAAPVTATATAPGEAPAPGTAASAQPPASSPTPSVEAVTPVGGLTVVRFHNNHTVYALTWYGLALMVLVAAWYTAREERRLRRAAHAKAGRGVGRPRQE